MMAVAVMMIPFDDNILGEIASFSIGRPLREEVQSRVRWDFTLTMMTMMMMMMMMMKNEDDGVEDMVFAIPCHEHSR